MARSVGTLSLDEHSEDVRWGNDPQETSKLHSDCCWMVDCGM